jgi:CCR4-NOT transcriptional regulation complex NOT5 subunit
MTSTETSSVISRLHFDTNLSLKFIPKEKSTKSKLIYSFPLKQRSTLLQISHKLQESNEIENKTCLTLFFLISYYYVFYAKIGHFPA